MALRYVSKTGSHGPLAPLRQEDAVVPSLQDVVAVQGKQADPGGLARPPPQRHWSQGSAMQGYPNTPY